MTPKKHDQQVSPQRNSGPAAQITIAVLLVLVAVFGLSPSPYAIERPGIVINTLGEITLEGEAVPVIEVLDAPVYSSDSTLNLLTVRLVGSPDHPLSWFSLVPSLFKRGEVIVPLDEVFASGQTSDERAEVNRELMVSSQVTATVAALTELGIAVETEVIIAGVSDGSAAEGLLQNADRVLRANGRAIESVAELRNLVGEHTAGDPLVLLIERDGVRRDITVIPEWSDKAQRTMLGVTLSARYELPIEVEIALGEIGGPSAGMVFALSLIETLGADDLVGETVVSGTGTVDDAGLVGPIGGLTSKLWAAHDAGTELFLMPLSNCVSLPKTLPEGMAIAPVGTLGEAIDALTAVREGASFAQIERCDRQTHSAHR